MKAPAQWAVPTLLEGVLAGSQVDLIAGVGVEEVLAGPAVDDVVVVAVYPVDEVIPASAEELVPVARGTIE